MKVMFLPAAAEDLVHAIEHYLTESTPDVASDLRDEVFRVITVLSRLPRIGHTVSGTYRVFGLRRFPYKLVYRVAGDTLAIVALAHDRREPRHWHGRQR